MGERLTAVELREKGEKFLGDLFQRIYRWAVDQGMEVVAEFENKEIPIWDYSGGRRPLEPETPGISLEKGVIFGKEGLTFAITLGKGHRIKYEREISTRLQFGVVYSLPKELGEDGHFNLQDLAAIVNAQPVRVGWQGEFYWRRDWTGIGIACRHDAKIFGGEEIGLLYPGSGWPQERILSGEGLAACLRIVERTVDQGRASK